MNTVESSQAVLWPTWKKITFRFVFVYLIFQIEPWMMGLNKVPFVRNITKYYFLLMNWAVKVANAKIFHIRPVLVPLNGSGDTSYGWAQLCLHITIAVIVCIIWSVIDQKRNNYVQLNYWLCLLARYYVAVVAFFYGIIKIFALQMRFPNLHELATPLGDFLPMRLSWMFIGYSTPYQVFSGSMEVLAATLLLFRRTTTLGVMIATTVFINVMMLNLCYDIPVKIFSTQLVFTCLFLLANESERIICFFILNQPAATCNIYHFTYTQKWMRVSRIILKAIFIIVAVGVPFYQSEGYASILLNASRKKQVLKNGVYEVTVYDINKHQTPILDTLRWQDLILENGIGSIKTKDTTFVHRYNRAYFDYVVDSASHKVTFKRMQNNVIGTALDFSYTLPDTNTIKLQGKRGDDSLFVELKRTRRHFQLAEKQFHWVTEYAK